MAKFMTRVFSGTGPNLTYEDAVFATDRLTEDECKALEKSVNKALEDRLDDDEGQYSFTLGPSPLTDLAGHIALLGDWERIKGDIPEGRSHAGWMSDLATIHDLAERHTNLLVQTRRERQGLTQGQHEQLYLIRTLNFHEYDFEAPYFYTNDLTREECQVLEDAITEEFAAMENSKVEQDRAGLNILTADEDTARFLAMVDQAPGPNDWDGKEWPSSNCKEYDIRTAHGIASSIAEKIRARRRKVVHAYVQVSNGERFSTVAFVDCLTVKEMRSLRAWLEKELHDDHVTYRIVDGWHARNEPETFIEAKLAWEEHEVMREYEKENGEVQRWRFETEARWVQEIVEELLDLRMAAESYAEVGQDAEDVGEETPRDDKAPSEPSADMKAGYRDPDNYERNVWLYRQREAGRTNAEIMGELTTRAAELGFAPLESDNALRSAIEGIARYHEWPILKGKAGRRAVAR